MGSLVWTLPFWLEEMDFLEFYSGYARTSLAMKSVGLKCAKADVKYFTDARGNGRNFFDIMTPAGMACHP